MAIFKKKLNFSGKEINIDAVKAASYAEKSMLPSYNVVFRRFV